MTYTHAVSQIVTNAVLGALGVSALVFILRPKYLLYGYMGVVFLFSGGNYGRIETIKSIYGRGTGVFPISLINIFLIIMFCLLLFRRIFRPLRVERFGVKMPLIMLALACISYFMWGLFISVPLKDILSEKGVINIMNMALLFFCFLWGIEHRPDVDRLRKMLFHFVILVGTFGIVRWAFFGGDPANIYMTGARINVRITFFDIGQHILFCIALSYSLLLLLKGLAPGRKEKLFYWIVILISGFNIVFCFRRTAWLGLCLVLFWITLTIDFRAKIWAVLVTAFLVLLLSSYVIQQRFTGEKRYDERETTLTGDITEEGKFSTASRRFAEFNAALQAIKKNYLFGVGPWGTEYGARGDVEHVKPVHSSIIHMALKMGFLGLLLYVWMLVSYISWWLRKRQRSWNDMSLKILSEAAFCGFLFLSPDIMFGTPIVLYRIPQLFAFILALTYLPYVFDSNAAA